jgi:hypothetical protein
VRDSLNHADESARSTGTHVVMIGILPTLTDKHLVMENLSSNPRYAVINEQIFAARGRTCTCTSTVWSGCPPTPTPVAPEAACTSCSTTSRSARRASPPNWNAAQAIAGGQVALGANSPFFLGRELWRETRIPLFEQATDTRSEELKAQGVRRAVWFGERWITSIFDLFEENVRYFPALLPICEEEDPGRGARRGGRPELAELRLHNGTIYRWNRPVYDVVRGKPHLRVENRVLPAGPPWSTCCANARSTTAWCGCWPSWTGRSGRRCRSARPRKSFLDCAKRGIRARVLARFGEVPATELVLRRLLPMAYEASRPLGTWRRTCADRLLVHHRARCLTGRTARRGRPRLSTASTRAPPRSVRHTACDAAPLRRADAHQRAGAHLAARLSVQAAPARRWVVPTRLVTTRL